MSQEIATIQPGPLALTAAQTEIEELKEAIAMNVGTGGLSEFDLPRITIAPGAFKVPTANGTALIDRIEGVIIFMRDVRAYYKSKDAGNRPPDCSSRDCIVGVGEPGGNCIPMNGKPGCPFAEFESATTADGKPGKGQACKQVKQLFMLRGESLLPEVLAIPPTSLKAATKFFNWVMGQRLPHVKALIAVTVQNAKNTQGQEYGTAVFQMVRRLSADEIARAAMFREMCRAFIERMTVDLPPEMYSAVE
jgi:hypothetical protein